MYKALPKTYAPSVTAKAYQVAFLVPASRGSDETFYVDDGFAFYVDLTVYWDVIPIPFDITVAVNYAVRIADGALDLEQVGQSLVDTGTMSDWDWATGNVAKLLAQMLRGAGFDDLARLKAGGEASAFQFHGKCATESELVGTCFDFDDTGHLAGGLAAFLKKPCRSTVECYQPNPCVVAPDSLEGISGQPCIVGSGQHCVCMTTGESCNTPTADCSSVMSNPCRFPIPHPDDDYFKHRQDCDHDWDCQPPWNPTATKKCQYVPIPQRAREKFLEKASVDLGNPDGTTPDNGLFACDPGDDGDRFCQRPEQGPAGVAAYVRQLTMDPTTGISDEVLASWIEREMNNPDRLGRFYCRPVSTASGYPGRCRYRPFFKRFNVHPARLEAVWYEADETVRVSPNTADFVLASLYGLPLCNPPDALEVGPDIIAVYPPGAGSVPE